MHLICKNISMVWPGVNSLISYTARWRLFATPDYLGNRVSKIDSLTPQDLYYYTQRERK